MRVLAFGEILWDIIEGKAHLGGAPFNFAAHAAQCGNEASIISSLGNDDLGDKALAMSRQYGVDCSFIQRKSQYPTGIVNVTLRDGQPDYVIEENVAYDFIEHDQALRELRKNSFDVFYFGSLAQRSTTSAATLERILKENEFKQVFYDVNLRKKGYSEDVLRKSLAYCSILKLNIDEVPVIAKMLWNDIVNEATFCRDITALYKNLRTIVITAADKGCMVYLENLLIPVPGIQVKVADAVGAGDAFSAAFMHSYMRHNDVIRAAQSANHMGAFVASKSGPIPEYSSLIKEVLGIGKR